MGNLRSNMTEEEWDKKEKEVLKAAKKEKEKAKQVKKNKNK